MKEAVVQREPLPFDVLCSVTSLGEEVVEAEAGNQLFVD
jgi:hypothetical protein